MDPESLYEPSDNQSVDSEVNNQSIMSISKIDEIDQNMVDQNMEEINQDENVLNVFENILEESDLELNVKELESEINANYPNEAYGLFAIKREETARKKIFELMPILDIFQPKNHIWHINVTLIFFGSFPPFYCKEPI